MRRVLLPNAGYTEIPLLEELKKLGCYVVTSGNRPDFPGHKLADKYVQADYSDKDALLKICQDENLDGIVSNAYDLGLVATSYVAEQMGWKGHDTYENTVRLHQKDSLEALCEELDIPSPRGRYFFSEAEALDYLDSVEYPIMVKAVDLSSGIGINRADNREEALEAVRIAFAKTRKDKILIEPYIVGHQESINAFVVSGKVKCFVTCDCYSPINPYLIQTETLMSMNYDLIKERLIAVIERMFDRLHLVDGIITMQYLVKEGKPYVIDMMRRCLGNRYLVAAEAITGFPWHRALVMAELGMDCSDLQCKQPRGKYTGHHAIMSSKNGIFQGIHIPDEVMNHVFEYHELFEKGQRIKDHMGERLGYIYYTYDTREELDWAAAHFNNLIKLDIE